MTTHDGMGFRGKVYKRRVLFNVLYPTIHTGHPQLLATFRMKTTVLSFAVVLSLQLVAKADLISDLSAVLSGTAQCSSCPSLLAGFKGLAALGDGLFVQLLTTGVCQSQVGSHCTLRPLLTINNSISTELSVKVQ